MSGAANFASEPLRYVPLAKEAAAKALELDADSARAYGAKGYLDGFFLMDWDRGERELRHAIQLKPQDATLHNWLGITLLVEGRFGEALGELRKAADLSPLATAPAATVGFALFCARHYDAALHHFTKTLELHPNDGVALHPFIGSVYEARGDFEKAMTEYQQVLAKSPAVKERIAHLLAATGRREEARRMLDEIENPATGAPDPFAIASICAALDEKDRAFEWLERAYAKRKIALLKVYPLLDPLRPDPRFQALLNRTGLAR